MFISKVNSVYKRDYAFGMTVMDEIFEIRSRVEILANDIKVDTTDQYIRNTFTNCHHTSLFTYLQQTATKENCNNRLTTANHKENRFNTQNSNTAVV